MARWQVWRRVCSAQQCGSPTTLLERPWALEQGSSSLPAVVPEHRKKRGEQESIATSNDSRALKHSHIDRCTQPCLIMTIMSCPILSVVPSDSEAEGIFNPRQETLSHCAS